MYIYTHICINIAYILVLFAGACLWDHRVRVEYLFASVSFSSKFMKIVVLRCVSREDIIIRLEISTAEVHLNCLSCI